MTIRLGVVMDPISELSYYKDSTLAMLWEAQDREWQMVYFEQQDLFLRDGVAYGTGRALQVRRDPTDWFAFYDEIQTGLAEFDVILMRKDPPFNEKYIYTTYLLEQAVQQGTLLVNHPQALRDFNEKWFSTCFPQCSPPSLITSSLKKLWEFWQEQGDIVCKPLDSMGGASVFRIRKDDVNATVIFETLTKQAAGFIMAQQFIPEIVQGDKRILLVNGNPVPFALARIPQKNDWRGNLAAGAKGKVQPLSGHDEWICKQVAPVLREKGIYFAGLDVIGDYLTEINITSPTGIREIDDGADMNISALLMDTIERLLG